MNQNLQNKLLKYSLGIVIILFVIIIFMFNKKEKSSKEEVSRLNKENELLEKQNKLAFLIILDNAKIISREDKKQDSLKLLVKSLKTTVKLRDKELSQVKNRYKGLSLDSLIKIAEKIYEKDHNIHSTPK